MHEVHVCVWHIHVCVYMWLLPESSMIMLSTYSFLQSLGQSQLGLWIFSSLICRLEKQVGLPSLSYYLSSGDPNSSSLASWKAPVVLACVGEPL